MYKIIILLLNLFFTVIIWAQERPPFSNETVQSSQWEEISFAPYAKGKFETVNLGFLSNNCGSAMNNTAKVLLQKISSISDIISKIKCLNPPQGINATYSLQTDCNAISEFEQTGLIASAELRFNALFRTNEDNQNSEFQTRNSNSSAIEFYFNDCKFLVNSSPLVENIFLQPTKVNSFMGYSVYEMHSNAGEYIIFTKLTKPLWLTVSVEEYIKKHITSFKNKIKELKVKQNTEASDSTYAEQYASEKKQRKIDFETAYQALIKTDKEAAADLHRVYEETEKLITESIKNNPEMQYKPGDEYNDQIASCEDAIADLQGALQSFGENKRKQTAYWAAEINELSRLSILTGLVEPVNANAHPLAKINPNLLDKNKDKSIIQLIIVHFKGISENTTNLDGYDIENQYLSALKDEKMFWESIINLLGK